MKIRFNKDTEISSVYYGNLEDDPQDYEGDPVLCLKGNVLEIDSMCSDPDLESDYVRILWNEGYYTGIINRNDFDIVNVEEV